MLNMEKLIRIIIADNTRGRSGGSRLSQTGGANPQGGDTNLLFRQIISRKLHENERNWTQRGDSLAPP